MSKAIDSLYLKLPAWAQNWAISAYGWRQRKVRYGQSLPLEYADVVAGGAVLAPHELKDRQARRFQALIAHAAQFVPHYTDLFKRLGVTPAEITLENYRTLLPILEKEEIVADPTRFHSTAAGPEALTLFTSGTSGSPMTIRCSPEARTINYAYLGKIFRENGSSADDRSVTFAGRVLFSDSERSRFWRKDYVNKTLYCSSYYISPETIPGYIRAMEEWRPAFIDTYPSSLSEIARYINANRVRHSIRPKFIFTSSETLTEAQRQDLETAFECKVVDQYGCTEMAVMAYSNGSGYRVEPLYALVEFMPRPDGEGAGVVTTGLLNFAMPLIRYRIGDVVAGPRVGAAGSLQDVSFDAIVGREDDSIVTPEGRRIGRMDPVFKGIDGIRKAQIVQRDVSTLEVLVMRAETGTLNEEQLKTNIRNRTSQAMNVRIEFVADIPLSKSGKFKAVVSKLK